MQSKSLNEIRYNPRTILITILVISVALRFIAALIAGDKVVNLPGTNDQISYHNLALRVLGGFGFTFGENWWPATLAGAPTAHWSYLYVFYLVLVYAIFGPHPLIARLIQVVLVGILQPLLAYKIGTEVMNQKVALVGAALTAIYIYFIYYSAMLMTEPFYIVAILGTLFVGILIVRRISAGIEKPVGIYYLAAVLGVTAGVAILLRQLFLLIVPFLLLWIMWAGRKYRSIEGKRQIGPVLPLMLTGVVLALMILPFTVFNYMRFHRFVLLNTNAGFAFFWGNHPIYGTHFIPILSDEMGGYQSLIPKELKGLDEASLDTELLRRGLGFVRDDPVRYVRLSLSRIPVFFMFWPSEDSGLVSNASRVLSFGLLWPFMLYGLVSSFKMRPWSFNRWVISPVFPLQLFVTIYSVIHLLTWALIRYRLPVDAILVLFAGLAFVDLAERFQTWRQERSSKQTHLGRDLASGQHR